MLFVIVGVALNMGATTAVYWDLKPLKTSEWHLGFGIWLGGYDLSWILILDPRVLSPEIYGEKPVAASQWYLDCPEPPNYPKS